MRFEMDTARFKMILADELKTNLYLSAAMGMDKVEESAGEVSRLDRCRIVKDIGQ